MPRKRNNSLIPIPIPNPASRLRSGTIYQSLPILPVVIPHNMDDDWGADDAFEVQAVDLNGQAQADANQPPPGQPQANANQPPPNEPQANANQPPPNEPQANANQPPPNAPQANANQPPPDPVNAVANQPPLNQEQANANQPPPNEEQANADQPPPNQAHAHANQAPIPLQFKAIMELQKHCIDTMADAIKCIKFTSVQTNIKVPRLDASKRSPSVF